MKFSIDKILSVILTISLPFILLMGAIRLLITPGFISLEYNRPGFPPDIYGFSQEERKQWADYAVNYLINDAGIEYLGDLKFEDGEPLYRQEELKHMQDVKNVVQTALTIWYVLLGLSVAILVWFASMGNWRQLGRSLRTGSWLTIGLIAFIIIMVAINFNLLFEHFHKLFFAEGSWQFYMNDTLIRLFPLPFWRDAFILVGLLSFIGAGLILWLTRNVSSKAA